MLKRLVYKDYLDSCKSYRQTIQDTQEQLLEDHPIIKTIKTDRLFSMGQHEKVYEFNNTLNSEQMVGGLLLAIGSFFDASPVMNQETLERILSSSELEALSYTLEQDRFITARSSLILLLRTVFRSPLLNERKRIFSLKLIDAQVENMQIRYQLVVREHLQLKKQLLLPL